MKATERLQSPVRSKALTERVYRELMVPVFRGTGLGRTFLALRLGRMLQDAFDTGERDRQRRLVEDARRLAVRFGREAKIAALFARTLARLNHEASKDDDLRLEETTLQELLALSKAHPSNAEARKCLAKVLYNTLAFDDRRRRSDRRLDLLEQLCALEQDGQEEPYIHGIIASGVFNALDQFEIERDYRNVKGALGRLKGMYVRHRQDRGVRSSYAKAIVSVLAEANEDIGKSVRASCLMELRKLAGRHKDDLGVRSWLAYGLHNSRISVHAAGDLYGGVALLREFELVADSIEDDGVAAGLLAQGLFDAIAGAARQGDYELRDTMLLKLRGLAETHRHDKAVREWLEKAHFHTGDSGAMMGTGRTRRAIGH